MASLGLELGRAACEALIPTDRGSSTRDVVGAILGDVDRCDRRGLGRIGAYNEEAARDEVRPNVALAAIVVDADLNDDAGDARTSSPSSSTSVLRPKRLVTVTPWRSGIGALRSLGYGNGKGPLGALSK